MNKFWKITTIINIIVIILGTTYICISAATNTSSEKTISTITAKLVEVSATPDEATVNTIEVKETVPETTEIAEKPTEATETVKINGTRNKKDKTQKATRKVSKKKSTKTNQKSSSPVTNNQTPSNTSKVITSPDPKPTQKTTQPDEIFDGDFLN